MKNPSEAIAKLDDLRGQVNQRVSRLGWEMEEIAERWAALGNLGGQRDDHAAALLGTLRFHLDDLQRFAAAVSANITDMVADPFQRNSAA